MTEENIHAMAIYWEADPRMFFAALLAHETDTSLDDILLRGDFSQAFSNIKRQLVPTPKQDEISGDAEFFS